MKGRFPALKILEDFKEHLVLEERSTATVEKYIRDIKIFLILSKVLKSQKKSSCITKSICRRITQFGA